MLHNLKIYPEWFKDIEQGTKTFEIRKHDRPFEVGHTIALREYNGVTNGLTGRSCFVRITRIYRHLPGLMDGYSILQIEKI